MEKKRLPELSYMNLFFCLLVVFIHIASEPVSSLTHSSVQYIAVMIPWRLSAYVVQGFIFLSGVKLVLNSGEGFDAPKFYFKRIKNIIFPYVLWVAIYYIYYARLGWVEEGVGAFLRYVVVGDIVSPFYFIVIITQFYILAPLFLKLTKRANPAWLLPVSFVLMMLAWRYLPGILRVTGISENFRYNDRVFTTYLFYFVFGFVGKYYEAFAKSVRKNGALIFFSFIVMSALNLLSFVFVSRIGDSIAELCKALYCVCAIILTFYLSDLLARKVKKTPGFIISADRATYLVYLCHCFVKIRVDYHMDAYGITDIGVRMLIRAVLVYFVSFSLCMVWNYVKKRINMRMYKHSETPA